MLSTLERLGLHSHAGAMGAIDYGNIHGSAVAD
jgi:hypothetical protein